MLPNAIDAHQHFWVYRQPEYAWIPPDAPIKRDFLPDDLMPLLDAASIAACIAVQARQSETETAWLLELAARFPRIAGVVGWVDLQSSAIEARLDHWCRNPALVGFRHVVQDEIDDDFLLRDAFVRGVAAVLRRGLSYDILITPRQTRHVRRFADLVGEGRLILDHGAKPDIANGGWQPWAEHIAEMALVPQLWCKVSGLVTEADHQHWSADQLAPYIEHLLRHFGPDRLMFGSDWPVCLLAADYARVVDIVQEFVARHCPEAAERIFAENARAAYDRRWP